MNNILKKLRLAGIFSVWTQKGDQKINQTFPNSSLVSLSSSEIHDSDNEYSHATTNSIASPPSNKLYIKMKNIFNKPIFSFLIIGIGLIIIILSYLTIINLIKPQSKTISGTNNKKIDIPKAKSSQSLNKEFLFPLKDANGKEISKLKYSIQNAELRDEIIVKGQRAKAVKGRTFLVLNLKITNNYNKSIQISARDYIRLSVNNSSEKLAPDIHNDPVEIQAISTKYTRLGFPINDTDANLTMQVGEIDGKKELIKLDLK